MENVSASFLDAVRKSMAAIRIAVGAATVDPERLTCAESLQYDGYLRREATGKAILGLSRQGIPIKKIARATGHSRKSDIGQGVREKVLLPHLRFHTWCNRGSGPLSA